MFFFCIFGNMFIIERSKKANRDFCAKLLINMIKYEFNTKGAITRPNFYIKLKRETAFLKLFS